LENPQRPNHGFSEILSNAFAVFKKSAAPGPGIFREKPQIPTKLRRRAVMIICGTGVLEVDAVPIFFGKARHLHRSFSKIRSNAIEAFRKSSAAGLRFLENLPQPHQGFWKIRSRSREHF